MDVLTLHIKSRRERAFSKDFIVTNDVINRRRFYYEEY